MHEEHELLMADIREALKDLRDGKAKAAQDVYVLLDVVDNAIATLARLVEE